METTTNTITPQNTTNSKRAHDPVIMTNQPITPKTPQHKEHTRFKRNTADPSQQAKAKPFKSDLTNIKLPTKELPSIKELRTQNKISPPASGKFKSMPRTPSTQTGSQATKKTAHYETNKTATVGAQHNCSNSKVNMEEDTQSVHLHTSNTIKTEPPDKGTTKAKQDMNQQEPRRLPWQLRF